MADLAEEREAAQGRLSRRVNAIVLAVVVGLVALMLALALGCRSVPADVREAAGVLAEEVPLLLDVSQPKDGLTEGEREARATLEAKVRQALVTLRQRAED